MRLCCRQSSRPSRRLWTSPRLILVSYWPLALSGYFPRLRGGGLQGAVPVFGEVRQASAACSALRAALCGKRATRISQPVRGIEHAARTHDAANSAVLAAAALREAIRAIRGCPLQRLRVPKSTRQTHHGQGRPAGRPGAARRAARRAAVQPSGLGRQSSGLGRQSSRLRHRQPPRHEGPPPPRRRAPRKGPGERQS